MEAQTPVQTMKRSVALFFSLDDLQLARDNIEREPLRGALSLLDTQPADSLAAAHIQALSYVFRRDSAAGDAAIGALQAQELRGSAGLGLPASKRQLAWLSVAAMLAGHPQWHSVADANLDTIDRLARRELSSTVPDLVQRSWLAAVSMAAAIVSDNDAGLLRAADVYRDIVDAQIHPEGYFKTVVDRDAATNTYTAQFSATCAMVLMAEMAGQAGLELWAHHCRAVSINTAATYTYYYYYFPERWRWEGGLTRDTTIALMRAEGAFFEMVNRRSPLRGVEQLFSEQRPMFSPGGGGLTTLTHGFTRPKKRRWGIF